jgi:hypothetical protein
VDRVLGPDYLLDLAALSTTAVRDRLEETRAELTELTRLGEQLDERIALITAEQRRRAAAAFDAANPPQAPAAEVSAGGRLARVFRLRADPDGPLTHRRRRRVERLIADVGLGDVGTRTDDELARVLRTFRHERRQVTDVGARVRTVADRCDAELGRRWVTTPGGAPEGPSGKALSGP